MTKGRPLLVCSVVLNGFVLAAASGQVAHFNPVSPTGENASLVLPSAATPSIDGVQLAIGDEVGIFSKEGLNVGAGSWTGENIAITVWGDNSQTQELDGVAPGDTILIRVWDQSDDVELNDVAVTYSQGNGLYAADAVLTLSSLEAQANLPVELASFEAVASGSDVHLSWTTMSERENAGFEIQRRSGDGQFVGVSFVSGAGDSGEPVTYSLIISNLEAGTHAFRFKQIDFSNGFSFSPVVEVAVLANTPVLLGNYPNPYSLHTTISYTLPRTADVTMTLFDALGRAVRVIVSGPQPAGINEFSFDATGLSAGVYFYRLRSADYVETRRMEVVR